MLGFIYVFAPHTSEKLSDALVESLMVWNIDKKNCPLSLWTIVAQRMR